MSPSCILRLKAVSPELMKTDQQQVRRTNSTPTVKALERYQVEWTRSTLLLPLGRLIRIF